MNSLISRIRLVRPVSFLRAPRCVSLLSYGVLGGCRALSGTSDSHDDFKPKVKQQAPVAATEADRLKQYVTDLISKNRVVLFMKGTPQQPMCGFSARAVQMLHANGADVHGVDILSDSVLRVYMKEFSSWQTFPQCYINGDFVGGSDILTEMHGNGELKKVLAEVK